MIENEQMSLNATLKDTWALLRGLVRQGQYDPVTSLIPGAFNIFAGHLHPVHIQVPTKYQSFRFELSDPAAETLNFSKIAFAGSDGISDKVQDLGYLASCIQSSGEKKAGGAHNGTEGKKYALNIHTEKEINPWWRADFPDACNVTDIFFFNRVDQHGARSKSLQVIGIEENGQEDILFNGWNLGTQIAHYAMIVDRAFKALEQLTQNADPELTKTVYNWCQECIRLLSNPSDISAISNAHASLCDGYFEFLYQLINQAPDFGAKRDSALRFPANGLSGRYLRLETYGKSVSQLGGVQVNLPEDCNEKPLTFWSDITKLKRKQASLDFNQDYIDGLDTPRRTCLIDLGKTVPMDEILVWNMDRNRAGSTTFLEIAVSNDGENWHVLHDTGQMYRDAMAAVRLGEKMQAYQWRPKYAGILGKLFMIYRTNAMVMPIVSSMRSHEGMVSAFEKGCLDGMSMVNFAFPLRLTKHGLQMPLKYKNQKKLMSFMCSLRDDLQKLGYKPLLMYGTLLGAIRDKDFIEHDDDVDMALIVEDTDRSNLVEKRNALVQHLNDNGIKCNAAGGSAPLIHCKINGLVFDLFLLGERDGVIHWATQRMKMDTAPADIFLPTKKIEFKGETFDVPGKPEEVLIARYGDTWRTPIAAFEL